MARRIERRLWLNLSDRSVLRSYMQYKGFRSVRELAQRAGVSRATIGHLHSGQRTTCSPTTARAIEDALGAPPGLLFTAEVISVQRDTRRNAA